jgi:hypothetical protein
MSETETETSRTQSSTSETQRPRRLLRSIGAVLAGLFVVIILSIGTDVVMHASKIYPPWDERMTDGLFLLATAYRCVYAVAGSYITARLAPDRPMKHAILLGFVGLALSIFGLVVTWKASPELGPKWYPLALVATALPCAWLGGKFRETQLSSRGISQS